MTHGDEGAACMSTVDERANRHGLGWSRTEIAGGDDDGGDDADQGTDGSRAGSPQ